MAASRFPGKPLYPICGMPMIQHVILRAKMYDNWDGLFLTTCDKEIKEFGESIGIEVIMTSSEHTRALDRIVEAVTNSKKNIQNHDIILNVQGDEPMLHPDMIAKAVNPMLHDDVKGTVLAMEIVNEEQYLEPDILKIIHDIKGNICTHREARYLMLKNLILQ